MGLNDETPWARRKRQKAEREAADAAMNDRVEDIRRALATYDRGGMTLGRFLENVESIATGGIVRVGEVHKPEVRG